MGCGGSKPEENPDEIKFQMKPTKVAKIDEFYDNASKILETFENMRVRFQDSRQKMNEIGRTQELKEPNLKEAFKVFFWSVSAHKGGKISAAGLDFSEIETMSFKLKCSDMDVDTKTFNESAEALLHGVTSGPKELQKLAEDLKHLIENPINPVTEIENSGLNGLDKAKASANAAINLKTLQKNGAKTQNVVKQVNEAAADLKVLLPQIKELAQNADVVGKQAADENVLKISQIFDKYQDSPKKTKEELEASKKEKGAKPEKKAKASKDASPDVKPEQKTTEPVAENKPAEENKQEEHKQEEPKNEEPKKEEPQQEQKKEEPVQAESA